MADPVVIVAGFGGCGTSLTMDMLKSGGIPVAGFPPLYEANEVRPSLAAFLKDAFPQMAQGAALRVIEERLPAEMRGVEGRIPPKWWATLHGCAVKICNPHLIGLPSGNHRAIWLDREDKHAQLRSMFKHDVIGDGEVPPIFAEYIVRYYVSRRDAAREALRASGADILDVRFEDLTQSPERCCRVVDRIAEFLGRDLDRDAMMKRPIWRDSAREIGVRLRNAGLHGRSI